MEKSYTEENSMDKKDMEKSAVGKSGMDKSRVDKKKKRIIACIASGSALIVALAIAGILIHIFRFDPEGYVSAVLDQTMKGETAKAARMMEGVREEDLKSQYETSIAAFAKNSIAGGAEMDADLEKKYIGLCKKIFAGMKYEVKSASKTGKGKYEVTVEYRPSDVMQKFIASAKEETAKLSEKAENGEYRGSLEEINAAMKAEFLANAYPLLEKAYQTMSFGKKTSIVFTVKKGEDGFYEIADTGMDEFITGILGI